jgi:hypothetical protein
MASINFNEIYSRFFSKVEAFDFLYEEVSAEALAAHMSEWIAATLSHPHIRKLFKTIEVNDEDGTITYEMNYEMDEYSDKQFLINVMAYGMVRAWLEPKVRSITNIVMNFGTSDAKFYSQSSHLSELRALLEDSEREIRSLVGNRGAFNNKYLDGDKL